MADISPSAVLALIQEQHIVEAEEPLTTDSDLFAWGLDSLAMMQLLLHLEQQFGRRLSPEGLTRDHFTTATTLAAWVSAQPMNSN
jgi:acyl carrier protein